MKLTIQIIALFFCTPTFSQSRTIEGLLPRISLLQIGNQTASGFFMQLENNIIFVTAKHCLLNEYADVKGNINRVPHDSILTIITYPKDVSKNKPDTLVVHFLNSINQNYLRYSFDKDAAIVYIGKIVPINDSVGTTRYQPNVIRLQKGTWVNYFTPDEVILFDKVTIGTEIIMGGYPKSLGLTSRNQYNFDRPLIRKGVVAGKAYELGNIIVDCPSYGGNSGGPIFSEFKKVSKDRIETDYFLIGLVSGFVPFSEVWYNQNYQYSNVEINNSGFSEIVPLDYIVGLYANGLKPFLK